MAGKGWEGGSNLVPSQWQGAGQRVPGSSVLAVPVHWSLLCDGVEENWEGFSDLGLGWFGGWCKDPCPGVVRGAESGEYGQPWSAPALV